MNQKIKPGHVLVEIVQGVEGPSLSIGDNDTGERVAGPKPWGGGHTIHCFQVAAKDLIRLAKEYASAEPSAPECTYCGDTGQIMVGRSGDANDGNAPIMEPCEDCVLGAPVERDERAAYDAWRHSESGYVRPFDRHEWSAWQARSALERKP